MSRTRNSVRNARVSIAFMLLTLLLTFFSRRIFIESLGVDLVGLTSTLQNILGFLNLAELGIVSAIATALYKPLYENDREKINDIISIFGYLYRLIGLVILFGGCLVALFLPLLFRDSGVELWEVYVGYFVYLFVAMIGYFISYRQTLLDADQKQYVIVAWTNIANIGKLVLQIIVLKFFKGGYWEWVLIELIFGIIYGFWINHKVKVFYPWLDTSYVKGKQVKRAYKDLFVTIKNVIPHKLGSFVLNQTSSFFIYAFTSLSMVTIYTNYTMILNKAVMVITIAFNGIGGSIGNLVAEGNFDRIKRVFWELQYIFFALGSVLVICCYYLVEPFMNLWLGEGFILDRVVFYLLLLNMFMGIIRIPIGLFLNGYVLFKDIWAPISEASMNLLIAIGAGYYWGVSGVVLGSTISLFLFVILWKPYFLYKEAFKKNVISYWKGVVKYILILFLTWGVVHWFIIDKIFINVNGWGTWCLYASGLIVITSILYLGIAMFFCEGGKEVLSRLYAFIKKK